MKGGVAMGKEHLGEFEELVLLAIARLGDNAYGVSIRQLVEGAMGRSSSVGAIHATTERLEQKGFVSSFRGEPTPERGGRAKRFFRLEGAGVRALEDVEQVRARL